METKRLDAFVRELRLDDRIAVEMTTCTRLFLGRVRDEDEEPGK